MERETKKLVTPSGKEFELKTYLTARERNDLRDVFTKNLTVDKETGTPKMGEFGGEFLKDVEYKYIQTVLCSFEGNAESILDRILDGSPEDYDFIATEAGKVANFKPAK